MAALPAVPPAAEEAVAANGHHPLCNVHTKPSFPQNGNEGFLLIEALPAANYPQIHIFSQLFKMAIGVKLGSKQMIIIIAHNFSCLKTQEKVLKSYDFRTFYGCGGRTRTYDLRVMSPTSFQLLYSAICLRSLETFGSITQIDGFVNTFFLLKFRYI